MGLQIGENAETEENMPGFLRWKISESVFENDLRIIVQGEKVFENERFYLEMADQGAVASHAMTCDTSSLSIHREEAGYQFRQFLRLDTCVSDWILVEHQLLSDGRKSTLVMYVYML